jgi:hypothetical protein
MDKPTLFPGKSLDGFTVGEITEIYLVNVHNDKRTGSVGFLESDTLAQSYIKIMDRPTIHDPADEEVFRTRKVLVLTNGTQTFLIDAVVPVTICSETETRDALREEARKKIPESVREFLGI